MRLLVLFLGALVASVRGMPARAVRRVSSARPATDPTRNEAHHHEAAGVDVLDVLDRAVTPFERKDSIILSLTVAKLREQCRKLGLRTGGNKGELQARLREFYRSVSPASRPELRGRKTKADLQRECNRRGVSAAGTKKDMVERLRKADEQQSLLSQSPPTSAAPAPNRYKLLEKSPPAVLLDPRHAQRREWRKQQRRDCCLCAESLLKPEFVKVCTRCHEKACKNCIGKLRAMNNACCPFCRGSLRPRPDEIPEVRSASGQGQGQVRVDEGQVGALSLFEFRLELAEFRLELAMRSAVLRAQLRARSAQLRARSP